MNSVSDKIRQRILRFLKLEHLSENPKDNRFNYINDADAVNRQHLEEFKVWYVGDSDELLNFYTNREIQGNLENPIYNRNKESYFWGISVNEKIKRVHSGLPYAMTFTLSNVVGNPEITVENSLLNEKLQHIIDNNNFEVMLNQEIRPITCVEGYGCLKPIFDKSLSDTPILQFYEGEHVKFAFKKGVLLGVVFEDFYKYKGKDYVLYETRRKKDNTSIIEFELFELDSKETLTPVPLDTIDELADLPTDGYKIENFNEVLAVPVRYFYDVNNKNYGKSIFCGKIDLFDDLDQSLSQRSNVCKKSTPIDYLPIDMLEKDSNGKPITPDTYDRKFIAVNSYPNGDGMTTGNIVTTQPSLNFDQYTQEQINIVNMCLTGILSPATLGIDIAKKDNAMAQREKEKVTIMTRNNIMAMETRVLKKIFSLCLCLQDYMDNGTITTRDYDISIKYSEFANPSFENLSSVLTPMWTQGAISTERYVEKLYGDSLSDEEKIKEIAWLDNERSKNDLELGDFDNEGEVRENTAREVENKEITERITE